MKQLLTKLIPNKEKCEQSTKNIKFRTAKLHTWLKDIGRELNTNSLSSYK
ncbi:MAG: hypothetical protein ACI88A_000410 [Paraglaciecola sp.]|jgi:hypothetical protein